MVFSLYLLLSQRKRNGSGQEVPMKCTNTVAKTPFLSQRNSKRTETKNPGSTANAKVKVYSFS